MRSLSSWASGQDFSAPGGAATMSEAQGGGRGGGEDSPVGGSIKMRNDEDAFCSWPESSSRSKWKPGSALSSTVLAVHAALQTASASGGGGHFELSDVDFHPGEYTWDVALRMLQPRHRHASICSVESDPRFGEEVARGSGFDLPVSVACLRADVDPATCRVELSLKGKASLWDSHLADVTLAMEWMRRIISRGVRRSSPCSADGVSVPVVSIRLPEACSARADEAEPAVISASDLGSCGSSRGGLSPHADAQGNRVSGETRRLCSSLTQDELRMASEGLLRSTIGESENIYGNDSRVILAMRKSSTSGDVRQAKRGLMSQKTVRRLSVESYSSDEAEPALLFGSEKRGRDLSHGEDPPGDKASFVTERQKNPLKGFLTHDELRKASMGLLSQKSLRNLKIARNGEPDENIGEAEVICGDDSRVILAMEKAVSAREVRQAKRGLMSQKTVNRLSVESDEDLDESGRCQGVKERQNGDSNHNDADGGGGGETFCESLTQKKLRMASMGLLSQRSLRQLSRDDLDYLARKKSCSVGEIRQARRGLLRQKTAKCLSIETDTHEDISSGEIGDIDKSGQLGKGGEGRERRTPDVPVTVDVHHLEGSLPSPVDPSGTPLSAPNKSPDEGRPFIPELTNKSPLPEGGAKETNESSILTAQTASTTSCDGQSDTKHAVTSPHAMGDTMEHFNDLPDSEEEKIAVPRKIIDAMKRHSKGSYSQGEIRQARRGILSAKTMKMLSSVSLDDLECSSRDDDGDADKCKGGDMEQSEHRGPPDGAIRIARQGCMSRRTIERRLGQNLVLGDKAANEHRDINNVLKKLSRYPSGEIRMARRGCASAKSTARFQCQGIIERLKRNVSFSDEIKCSRGEDDSNSGHNGNAEDNEALTTSVDTVNKVADVEENEAKDALIFSDNELKTESQDILTEGQCYLGISMLVYMYSHLRETCRMGHTRVAMEDIDVHSLQSQYKVGAAGKYLSETKTAGSIIRVLIDELERADDDDMEHDIVGDENKEYERSITSQFRTWIQDSKVSQLDEETEKMIAEMKRKVARHRWRRAISAVRLSYKLSGGKRPKFDNVVVAPGCESTNRFVDMNEMMSEAIRTQSKYFRKGSVMHNIMESGIEMVWFSDMSQSDVVYGIAVQREEKKVTVVFRGTVNAHNWRMNLKFDTNEYRNPVKQSYPGRVDELSLHSGFALYLLRKRKDTGLSKLQEIFDKIHEIGMELAPDGDYKLAITGHSLGGALATLCGFYAAARPCFASLSTIYVWTFAAPRVGTQAFIHAWQHLERTGRIRHARFSVTHDLVPLVPFCNFEANDLQFYKHVGMRVQLHGVGRLGKRRLRNALDVTYPLRHDWLSEIKRAFMNNFLVNLATPSGFKHNHGLTEYQKRLHFAMSYRKALGSGVLFSDRKRNRIKTLDEYYHIRANIMTDGVIHGMLPAEVKVQRRASQVFVLFVVFLLMMAWLLLIIIVTTDYFESHPLSIRLILSPFSFAASGVWHSIKFPFMLPMTMCRAMSLQAGKAMDFYFGPAHEVRRTAFVGRRAFFYGENKAKLELLINELAARRADHYVGRLNQAEFSGDQKSATVGHSTKRRILESTANGLFDIAALVDGGAQPHWTITAASTGDEGLGLEEKNEHTNHTSDNEAIREKMIEQRAIALSAAESQLKPIQEYATGVNFAPKLGEGLYLVGAGVRKKSIIKVYAVAMYSSAAVLHAASHRSLASSARTFDPSTQVTSFVLEMVLSIGVEKVAEAITESVKPRYVGLPDDLNVLKSLIIEGVRTGDKAKKGTVFRFDCSGEGVGVYVDGHYQGSAIFNDLGSAFVDVFMDDDAVSPTLVDSCIETWSTSESKALSSSLLELNYGSQDLSL